VKVTDLSDVEPRRRRVAVGTFDGVHLGHREVIRGADTVLTFEPHPAAIVSPAGAPRLLTPLERKAELIGELGVQELVVVPFDEDFAARSAESFVDDVLVGGLRAGHVSVGENFRFGNKAKGDTQRLLADDRFETRVVPLLEVDGEVVSSSHIRGLVLGGAVEYADKLLGAPFTFCGEVTKGDQRGRTLGFPTANLHLRPGLLLPPDGVYAVTVTVDGARHAGVMNIGVRPTFAGRRRMIEVHLLDFTGDLYRRWLVVHLIERLRGEKAFPGPDALRAAIAADVARARDVLAGEASLASG